MQRIEQTECLLTTGHNQKLCWGQGSPRKFWGQDTQSGFSTALSKTSMYFRIPSLPTAVFWTSFDGIAGAVNVLHLYTLGFLYYFHVHQPVGVL